MDFSSSAPKIIPFLPANKLLAIVAIYGFGIEWLQKYKSDGGSAEENFFKCPYHALVQHHLARIFHSRSSWLFAAQHFSNGYDAFVLRQLPHAGSDAIIFYGFV